MTTTGILCLPLASGIHHLTPTSTTSGTQHSTAGNLGVAVNIVVFDSSNAHNSVPMPASGLRHTPFTSDNYHLASTLTTLAPALATFLQHSPLVPTTHLLRPPDNSGNIHKPNHILGVSVKIVVFDGSGDHHRVPLDFCVHHWPPASTTRLWPLSFDAHHSPSALTSRLRCPPLNSSQLLTYLLNPSSQEYN